MSSLKNITISRALFNNCLKSCEGVNCQFVRYRKPRFFPKAPTKVFNVREPTPKDPVEMKLMQEWQNNYNTARRAVQSFLVNYTNQLEASRKEATVEQTFEEKYAYMVKKNEEWNKETTAMKEQDVAEKTAMAELRERTIAEREERERQEMIEEARQRVLQAKEHQDYFITPENLDLHIEELLNTRSDHDFALYLDGSTTKDEQNNITPPDNEPSPKASENTNIKSVNAGS